jgi:hypothetical protein
MRSGFESTGLYPFSVERALSKLPKEDRVVETAVQAQLLKRLNDLRYNPPPTTHAARPKKKEKLPAGEAYTCSGSVDSEEEDEPAVRRPRRVMPAEDSESSSSSDYSDQSSSEEERNDKVHKIVEKVRRKRCLRLFEMGQGDQAEEMEDDGEKGDKEEEEPNQPVVQPAQDSVEEWVYKWYHSTHSILNYLY